MKKEGTYISNYQKIGLSIEERRLDNIEYQKQYRKKNYEELKQKKQEYMNKIKHEGIEAYGGKCTCCSEYREEFLTLEHINGRNPETKRVTGKKMWARAKSLNYPEDYTILCFNCNCAKGAFGYCPHELEKGDADG